MKLRKIICTVLVLILALSISGSAFAIFDDFPSAKEFDYNTPSGNPSGEPVQGETVDPSSIVVPLVLSRVADESNKYVVHELEIVDGVMTVTAERDFARFTNKISTLKTLAEMGVEKIVFVTNGAVSEFNVADLLEKTEDADAVYDLIHDGETVSFVIGDTDVSDILAGAEEAPAEEEAPVEEEASADEKTAA